MTPQEQRDRKFALIRCYKQATNNQSIKQSTKQSILSLRRTKDVHLNETITEVIAHAQQRENLERTTDEEEAES